MSCFVLHYSDHDARARRPRPTALRAKAWQRSTLFPPARDRCPRLRFLREFAASGMWRAHQRVPALRDSCSTPETSHPMSSLAMHPAGLPAASASWPFASPRPRPRKEFFRGVLGMSPHVSSLLPQRRAKGNGAMRAASTSCSIENFSESVATSPGDGERKMLDAVDTNRWLEEGDKI